MYRAVQKCAWSNLGSSGSTQQLLTRRHQSAMSPCLSECAVLLAHQQNQTQNAGNDPVNQIARPRPRTKPKRKKIGKRKTPAADCRCTSSLPPRLHPMSSLAPAPRRSRFLGFELNSDEPVVVVVVRILASSSLASVRREENASPGRMSRRRSSPAPLDDDEQPS
jgi:hypothetical protein